jgi:hypothetical protein
MTDQLVEQINRWYQEHPEATVWDYMDIVIEVLTTNTTAATATTEDAKDDLWEK